MVGCRGGSRNAEGCWGFPYLKMSTWKIQVWNVPMLIVFDIFDLEIANLELFNLGIPNLEMFCSNLQM